MRLIFLGPPGAGKTTQASILAANRSISHVSVGDLLRQAMAGKTSLGLQAQPYVKAGELVPDLMMSALIQERLTESDSRQGWILDGFPRTLAQAQILEDLLQRLQQPCDLVIYFDVTTQLLLERLLQRGRHDDREEIICKRLAIYDQ